MLVSSISVAMSWEGCKCKLAVQIQQLCHNYIDLGYEYGHSDGECMVNMMMHLPSDYSCCCCVMLACFLYIPWAILLLLTAASSFHTG